MLQGKKSLSTFISKVVSVLKLNKINTTVAGSTYHYALGNCLLWQGLVKHPWLDKSSLNSLCFIAVREGSVKTGGNCQYKKGWKKLKLFNIY